MVNPGEYQWSESVERLHNPPSYKNNKAEAAEIGDRVVVNGTQSGTLRFLGSVQFSHGIWAGVELDEPCKYGEG